MIKSGTTKHETCSEFRELVKCAHYYHIILCGVGKAWKLKRVIRNVGIEWYLEGWMESGSLSGAAAHRSKTHSYFHGLYPLPCTRYTNCGWKKTILMVDTRLNSISMLPIFSNLFPKEKKRKKGEKHQWYLSTPSSFLRCQLAPPMANLFASTGKRSIWRTPSINFQTSGMIEAFRAPPHKLFFFPSFYPVSCFNFIICFVMWIITR